MKKVAILDYLSLGISIISISDNLLKEYDNNIEEILMENSLSYKGGMCDWTELNIDSFGNFNITNEILNERKS